MIFHTPKSARTKLTVASFAFVLMLFFNAGSLQAQLKAKVTVDPTQAKATVYTTSFGIAADRWDKKW